MSDASSLTYFGLLSAVPPDGEWPRSGLQEVPAETLMSDMEDG